MNEYVADTHALYWYLIMDQRLGPNALAAFREGEQGLARIYIPSIVLAELYYLNIKAGSALVFANEFIRLAGANQFVFVEFRAEDVLRFDALLAIPEMHDRIIAGVSMARMCPCLTRDTLIVGSGLVSVVW
jgi:PIN domain nuclease of toxin-antitoxin system